MGPMRLYLVDDEQLARTRFKRLLDKYPQFSVCGEASNGEDALIGVAAEQPDIVILDIRMPGMDGLEVAQRIGKLDTSPAVVFCSAYEEYALQAFKLNAIGYLLKPVDEKDMLQALNQAQRLSQAQLKQVDALRNDITKDTEHFIANTWKGQERIPINEIYYFRADQKYLSIVHRHGETLSNQTLKQLEQDLGDAFIRVHRNAIVNGRHIKLLQRMSSGKYAITLGNEESIDVSRRHVARVKAFIQTT